MRRTFLAAGLAAMVMAAAGAVKTATSQAGPPPPPPPFSSVSSDTPPVAGRAFTAFLVGHLPTSGGSWKLSCSASLRGHSIFAHGQGFGLNPWAGYDTRSCGLRVPRRTGGSVLVVTVNALDQHGHTYGKTRRLRIFSHATMTPVPLGAPQPDVIYDTLFSQTRPVTGRAFTAVFVQQETGGPWALRCSISLGGRSILAHRQEFGFPNSVPDIRTCEFQVPRSTTGKLLHVTVDATTPDGQAVHATRAWQILGVS